MRFGYLPLAEAEGAILAHSMSASGFSFRKGRLLSSGDVGLLESAGFTAVMAAKLEPGDVAEDMAATRIAQTLQAPGLSVSAAFTGRVNIFAEQGGLLDVDVDRLDRLNLLDEAITVATLLAMTPVMPGHMVATVKIIPFAVPAPLVTEAERLASGLEPLLRLHPWKGHRAALIQTTLSGPKPSILDKTAEVTRSRLETVGAFLLAERRVPHDSASLAAALTEMKQLGCDLLLIAGASAITDRRDVLPSGIETAGGTIVHFGMPVDPGNLLLLGKLGTIPVLGLPGCARSPKLNGFDWILQRLAAGLEVTRTDIMRMGAGGLLAEIPSRPLPRATPPILSRAPKVAALVLAGGLSRRMGRNKLLAPFKGAPLLSWAVDAALASSARPVLVVTGHQSPDIRAALADRPIGFIHAGDHEQGLSASLKAGLSALPDEADAVLILLGDMPRVDADVLNRLIAAYNPQEGRCICVPTHQGRRGNPVLWDRRFLPEMLALSGDTGARSLLDIHADQVCEVDVTDDGVLLDVDTPAALAALENRHDEERRS